MNEVSEKIKGVMEAYFIIGENGSELMMKQTTAQIIRDWAGERFR